MKRIHEKWNSARGASILTALLLLLVCMMVAASVLMAAASNAGKLRSNREEHQKYLTLSSALRLVCGEIEASSYVGRYSYDLEDVQRTVETTDGEGNITTGLVHDYYIHTYAQADGIYICGLNDSPGASSDILPLLDRLDFLFGEKLAAGAGVARNPDDRHIFAERPIRFNFPIRFTLTVKADGFEDVTVTFQLRKDGVISLTAALPEDETGHIFAMEAELIPVKPLDEVFLLRNTEPYQTEQVKWRLNWIAKKEAEEP